MSTRRFPLSGAAPLLALLIRWLNWTLRWRVLGRKRVDTLISSGQAYAYATLHGSSLLLLPSHVNEPLSVLVSRSRDGDLAAGLLDALGLGHVRGSSSHGSATAFRSLCRASREGRTVTLTVDGPRGPAGVVAPGIMALSQVEGLWVVPVAAACASGLELRSWDRCKVPLPWTRAVMVYGRPFKVDRQDRRSSHQARLQTVLRRLHFRARRLCGDQPTAVQPAEWEGLSAP